MKKIGITYLFFYCTFLLVICVAIFYDKRLLLYIKPIPILFLILLYFKYVRKINVLFPISMVLIISTDTFNYLDFVKYYDIIAVQITTFYILCIFLLKGYISRNDLNFNKLISLPLIIGVVLISYLMLAVIDLVLPKINNSIGSIVIIVISLILFSAISFTIHITNRYERTIYLFIAASCTLFVDALMAINELYYYAREFTVLINIAEIAGLYFFTSFFIETKSIDLNLKEDNFL